MDPLTAGLITGGLGIFQSFMGYNQERDAAQARNRQRRQEFRQRLAIRNTEWNQQVKAYKLRVQGYEQGLKNRAKVTALQLTQDELNLNQMMKGMRFASQDAAIAQAQQTGRTQATAQAGKTAGRRMVMDVAAFGRNQAKREERMLGAISLKTLLQKHVWLAWMLLIKEHTKLLLMLLSMVHLLCDLPWRMDLVPSAYCLVLVALLFLALMPIQVSLTLGIV